MTIPPGMTAREFLEQFLAPEMRAWRGQMKLSHVFWGYGVLFSNLLLAIQLREFALQRWALLELLLIFSVVYTAWLLVAIWRCAAFTDLLWGTLARWLAIAWGLNAAFVIVFVQFTLIASYASF